MFRSLIFFFVEATLSGLVSEREIFTDESWKSLANWNSNEETEQFGVFGLLPTCANRKSLI